MDEQAHKMESSIFIRKLEKWTLNIEKKSRHKVLFILSFDSLIGLSLDLISEVPKKCSFLFLFRQTATNVA